MKKATVMAMGAVGVISMVGMFAPTTLAAYHRSDYQTRYYPTDVRYMDTDARVLGLSVSQLRIMLRTRTFRQVVRDRDMDWDSFVRRDHDDLHRHGYSDYQIRQHDSDMNRHDYR